VSTSEAGTHKLWGGRFAGGPSPLLDAINRSIGTDFRLWPHDVRLSKAWALALGEAGVLTRDESDRSHVYRAARSEGQTQRQVIRHLLERVFSGSAPKLVMQALAAKRATPAELAEIRRLLDEMERGGK